MTTRFPEGGNCYRTEDPAFFPNTEKPEHPAVQAVKTFYCQGCPVRTECLQWALDTQSDWGIFGGTTGEERNSMRKPKRRNFAPTGTKKASK